MDQPQASFEQPQPKKEPRGLVEEGRDVLACQVCGKPLIEILRVKDKHTMAVATKIKADCAYCGGCSSVLEVPGSFFPGSATDELCFDIGDPDANDVITFTTRRI